MQDRLNEAVRVTGIVMLLESPRLQYNLNGSNTDGSFTVDDSNFFFSPCKILPIVQENKYLGIFPFFIMELYVVCTRCKSYSLLLCGLFYEAICFMSYLVLFCSCVFQSF